jgi:hypothetical protein
LSGPLCRKKGLLVKNKFKKNLCHAGKFLVGAIPMDYISEFFIHYFSFKEKQAAESEMN